MYLPNLGIMRHSVTSMKVLLYSPHKPYYYPAKATDVLCYAFLSTKCFNQLIERSYILSKRFLHY